MAPAPSRGTCLFCAGELSKSAMSRHLAACARRRRGTTEWLPVVVEGIWAPAYWLHLEVKPDAPLGAIDAFLRETWLECCGHLSSFEIGDRRFESDLEDVEPGAAEGMEIPVAEAFAPGATARYVYDFGSSTELRLRALAPRLGASARVPVRLVARNTAPSIQCSRGDGDALHVCAGCGDPVCGKCAPRHRCGPEMLLPVVNSPRVGTCAYGT